MSYNTDGMSNAHNHNAFYGVDREHIAVITAKAKRERNAAIREMVSRIFGSVSDDRTETPPKVDEVAIGTARFVHL